ncbi:MAG TPA: ABC transporter permease [Flavobacteriaceae bacterium]|nr:ABC transporter permease [Flavobacteriaceae bacterium]
MRNLKLIIKREYTAKVRNKTFIVMTFLSPLIMVGMIALIAYLSMLNEERQQIIAVHDPGQNVTGILHSDENTKFVDFSTYSLETAKDSVIADEYDGLLSIPPSSVEINNNSSSIVLYTDNSPDNSLLDQLEAIISNKITNERLEASGVNLEKLADAKTQVSIKIENFSGEQTSKISLYIKMFFGGAMGYLLMMFIIIYGNMVMRSVIEEKTNRIVEIIISSVKPIQLMLGKIIGTSLAGITQFIIWVVLGGILMFLLSFFLGMDMSEMQGTQPQAMQTVSEGELQQLVSEIMQIPMLQLVIYFIIYFLGGYFLYSSIYAAIGAAVDNETDTQQFMLPVILPLMLGIYVGFFAVIENPHGTVSTIFSMIPLTSPVVMLMRVPFGVPWWELALSIAILVLSIMGTVWLSAKIYRVGVLMYGKKPTYKELYKWLRY